jgi:hypothetical protein
MTIWVKRPHLPLMIRQTVARSVALGGLYIIKIENVNKTQKKLVVILQDFRGLKETLIARVRDL